MWNPEEYRHLADPIGGWRYPWWQDSRHVYLQYCLVMTNYFHFVCEIGCHKGFSSSAYVQALKDGAHIGLTLCDRAVTPELKKLVDGHTHVKIMECDSLTALRNYNHDLVILDGDHTMACVERELGYCLYSRTGTIILHDWCAGHVPNCDGPPWAAALLMQHPLYTCAWDNRKREGEYTDRGILVASRLEHVTNAARQVIGGW